MKTLKNPEKPRCDMKKDYSSGESVTGLLRHPGIAFSDAPKKKTSLLKKRIAWLKEIMVERHDVPNVGHSKTNVMKETWGPSSPNRYFASNIVHTCSHNSFFFEK